MEVLHEVELIFNDGFPQVCIFLAKRQLSVKLRLVKFTVD